MSDYAFVADQAKKVFATVAKLENELVHRPSDRGLLINLTSMRRRAEQAKVELERLAALNHIEICQYRIVPADDREYGLRFVAKSLLEYQNLFSQLYDAFKNGKKSNAQIGREAELESALDFAYTYSGSLGVVLLAQSDRDFFSGNLDRPIDALYQILEINDVDAVKDIAQTLGRAVVKRVHDWSKANVDGGFSADIRWKRSDGKLLGQMIDRSRMEKIVKFIGSTADEQVVTNFVRGMLVGANVSSRTFHIAQPGGETYIGHFSPHAVLPEDVTLGRMYEAEIDVSETYYYATERTVKSNALKRLTGPLPPILIEE